MFGRCLVCLEKDNRITDLLAQVDMLKKVAFPTPATANSYYEAQELDRLLSGSDDVINVPTTAEQLEAASLLTGSYDNSQVEI